MPEKLAPIIDLENVRKEKIEAKIGQWLKKNIFDAIVAESNKEGKLFLKSIRFKTLFLTIYLMIAAEPVTKSYEYRILDGLTKWMEQSRLLTSELAQKILPKKMEKTEGFYAIAIIAKAVGEAHHKLQVELAQVKHKVIDFKTGKTI